MHHRTLTLALAVPLCCLAHRHAAGQPAKAADRVEQGRELLAQGDLAGAQEQFAAELAAGPQGERRIGDVNFYLGLVSQRQAEQAVKDPQAAEKLRRAAQNYFREATKWRSDSAGSWHNLALVSDRLGDAKTADDAFRRAIGLRTEEQTTFLVSYAGFLYGHDQPQDAARLYAAALAQQPGHRRAREGLNRFYLDGNVDQLVRFAWRLYEQGDIDYAQDLALQKLEQGAAEPPVAKSLLVCVVRCLARQEYDPQPWANSEAAQRVSAAANRSNLVEAASEIIELHRGESLDRSTYRWWSGQAAVEWEERVPPGGWPLDAFTELCRSLGDRYFRVEERDGTLRPAQRTDDKRAPNPALAERYFQLAYRLNDRYLDPIALPKLADLWMATGNRDRLERFVEEESARIFHQKGESISRQDYRRMYYMHRALALIYMHLDRWMRPDGFQHAAFQVEHANRAARDFNAAAQERKLPERLGDWRLTDRLAGWYVAEGRRDLGFALRVEEAQSFRAQGLTAEAASLFRPIAEQAPPARVPDEVKAKFRTLRTDFSTELGFAPLRDALGASPSRSIKTAVGEARISFELPGLNDGQVQALSNVVEQLLADLPEPANKTAERAKVRWLPDQAEGSVEEVRFDGRRGVAEVHIGEQLVRVPFSVDRPRNAPALGSVQVVRPPGPRAAAPAANASPRP